MKKTLRNDIFLIVALLAVSACIYWALKSSAPGKTCEITVGGELFCEAPLDKDDIIDVDGILTVEISGKSARVTESICKNKICVAHPPISLSGETIICAPGGVMIKISGDGPDFIQ